MNRRAADRSARTGLSSRWEGTCRRICGIDERSNDGVLADGMLLAVTAMPAPDARPGSPPAKNMVWVPGGTFQMGSADFYPEERPSTRSPSTASGWTSTR